MLTPSTLRAVAHIVQEYKGKYVLGTQGKTGGSGTVRFGTNTISRYAYYVPVDVLINNMSSHEFLLLAPVCS